MITARIKQGLLFLFGKYHKENDILVKKVLSCDEFNIFDKMSEYDKIHSFNLYKLVKEDEILKDDKNYQTNYYCSTVVRKDALEKYPKLEETLELMDGILTDEKMAELNYQVEEEGKDEAEVAKEFLLAEGLLKK